ncbi:MAG: serine/threonine-protein kinase [Isosphaeraceae bacterium]
MSPRARQDAAFSFRGLIGPHRPSAGTGSPPIGDPLGEFERRWLAGERPIAEDYADRVDDDGLVDLIYKEFCLREALDETPDPIDYLDRFPHLDRRLRSLFTVHGAFESAREIRDRRQEHESPPPRPLEAGDRLGPYLLIRELGRGQFGCVFLAAQSDMEDRLVVVKVGRRPSLEPRMLAKAQHRHVVEVLAAGKTLEGHFHWVCLPFRGGATLADILAEWRSRKARPSTGREFLDLLDAVAAPENPPSRLSRAARELIAAGSHAQGMAWMVARLAEALDHAFRQGITHEDVKPSNILVTADGDPMLLDFSLGLGLQAPGDEARGEWGSLHYMSPERLREFADGRGGRPSRPLDNHRADIYALGLVLAEAISGRPPYEPQGDADLLPWEVAAELAKGRGSESGVARRLKDVPLGLRPILSRCLAPDPSDRYRAAVHLAEDLDRWRNDRPPIHCNTRSAILPLFRWARKRRAALAGAALFLSAGLLASVAVLLRIRDGTQAPGGLGQVGRLWGNPGPDPGFDTPSRAMDPDQAG